MERPVALVIRSPRIRNSHRVLYNPIPLAPFFPSNCLPSHTAGMHAREWIGSAVATYIISQLVEKNASYAKLLDNADWMILPVANPDSYEFTHTGDRLWRKTRSNHGENQDDSRILQLVNRYARWFWGNCEGVDPNRNFGYHWGEVEDGGASLDPCHEIYAGPHAFSEPDTKAMADYILANKQNIRMYPTLHSYSQMWLVPWGYTYSKPSDYSELADAVRKTINAISKVHGTSYQLGPSADLLYRTSGASDDWAKGVAGIKYARPWNFEIVVLTDFYFRRPKLYPPRGKLEQG